MSLQDLIQSALSSTWSGSQPELAAQLEMAESAVNEYAAGLATINGDPVLVQEQVSTFRASKYAEAFVNYRNSLIPSEASAVAQAIVSYLQAHSQANYIPGKLVAPNGPVTAPGGPISTIVYT